MGRSLQDPDTETLAPSLQRWCSHGAAHEHKTAIIRPRFSVNLKDAVHSLEESGAEVQSSGRGAITVVVSPESLAQVAQLPWVVAIEEPRRMFARAAVSV
jgi:hypothetical protein